MSHWIYRAYDADGRVLYVGRTRNLRQRMAAHRRLAVWAPFCTRLVQRGPYDDSLVAAEEEARQIDEHWPIFNLNHTAAARLRNGEVDARTGAIKAAPSQGDRMWIYLLWNGVKSQSMGRRGSGVVVI